MKEDDVPPPTEIKIGVATVNSLGGIADLLTSAVELLKQVVVNTTPKKAP